MTEQGKILVTGATGNVGGQVVSQLLDAGAAVRAFVRDPDTAGRKAGVEVVKGDLSKPKTLEAALEFRFWAGRPTEAATFEKALAGPWAPLGDDLSLRRLLAAARAAQEPERLALYAEAQTLCAKAAPVVVAAHVPALTVCTPRLVHGGAVSPHGSLDGGRLPERWWFA